MKYNLELLKADVLDELANIEKLVNDFRCIEDKLSLPENKMPYYDRAAIGYYLHSFYNGCENIFRSVARFFENDLGPQAWHSDLLKRMKLVIPGYRPAMIDDSLYRLLDDFRAFRHLFRHSYSFDLDWEKERLVAMKFQTATTMLQDQVKAFLENLEQIEL
jgi:hypothetical protein